jgi:glutamate racemase
MYNEQLIAVFGTRGTVDSGTYPVEINKRCPAVRVVQQACPELAGAIEAGAVSETLRGLVSDYVAGLMAGLGGEEPEIAILGCTHYPLVKHLFRAALPPGVKLLCQASAVANSLEHYLRRHPEYVAGMPEQPRSRYFTTGDPGEVTGRSGAFLGRTIRFQRLIQSPARSVLPRVSRGEARLAAAC